MYVYIFNMYLIKVVRNLVLYVCMYVCSCVLVNEYLFYESLLRKIILFFNYLVIYIGNYFLGVL